MDEKQTVFLGSKNERYRFNSCGGADENAIITISFEFILNLGATFSNSRPKLFCDKKLHLSTILHKST